MKNQNGSAGGGVAGGEDESAGKEEPLAGASSQPPGLQVCFLDHPAKVPDDSPSVLLLPEPPHFMATCTRPLKACFLQEHTWLPSPARLVHMWPDWLFLILQGRVGSTSCRKTSWM